jgi:hypothetical protein
MSSDSSVFFIQNSTGRVSWYMNSMPALSARFVRYISPLRALGRVVRDLDLEAILAGAGLDHHHVARQLCRRSVAADSQDQCAGKY